MKVTKRAIRQDIFVLTKSTKPPSRDHKECKLKNMQESLTRLDGAGNGWEDG